MFDFAWSEIALIGVVALVLIGPKDMPVAIRAVTTMVKRARKMAAEFQTHVDELARDANLHEVQQQIREIRNFDIRGEVERAVDRDGSIRQTLNENPLSTPIAPPPMIDLPPAPPPAALPEATVETTGQHAIDPPAGTADALAFVPPGHVPTPAAPSAEEKPAFIPPNAHRA